VSTVELDPALPIYYSLSRCIFYFVPNKSKLENFAQQFTKLMQILRAKAASKDSHSNKLQDNIDFVAID